MTQKIGIYSGTFDPIHEGHVAFALASRDQLGLDTVIFLPEETPRLKTHVTPLAMRKSAIEERIAGDDSLAVLALPQPQFTLEKTLPVIHKLYPNTTITLLVGSDVALHLHEWPHVESLQSNYRLAVGIRADCDKTRLTNYLDVLAINYDYIATDYASLASSQLRDNSK